MVSLIVFFAACQNTGSEGESDTAKETTETETSQEEMKGKISIEPLTPTSPAYNDAVLELSAHNVKEDGSVEFQFNVENYELGVQTSDADNKGLANSGKGQHIHFIDNNDPYSAHYEAEFTKELEAGNHVILAFLSRSYHESVKAATASVVKQIQIGETDAEPVNLDQPIMFYSRPKGTYKGEDTKNILLDFYLHNVNLSKDGYKVRATINGQEFTLTQWLPYVIKGAPMGELTVKLELLDAEGNWVDAPFNPAERTVKLKPAS